MGIYCIWDHGQSSQQCVCSQVFSLVPRVLYVDYEVLRGFSNLLFHLYIVHCNNIYICVCVCVCVCVCFFFSLRLTLSITVNSNWLFGGLFDGSSNLPDTFHLVIFFLGCKTMIPFSLLVDMEMHLQKTNAHVTFSANLPQFRDFDHPNDNKSGS